MKAKYTLFKFIYLYRKIKILLGFYEEHSPYHIFNLSGAMSEMDFYKKVMPLGYQYNYFSNQEKNQIFNARKLYGDRQIHIRLFNDGEIRGHDELNYEFNAMGHVKGTSMTAINGEEIFKLSEALR